MSAAGGARAEGVSIAGARACRAGAAWHVQVQVFAAVGVRELFVAVGVWEWCVV